MVTMLCSIKNNYCPYRLLLSVLMVPLDNGFLILGVGIILPTVVPNSEIHISRFVPARSSDKLSRAHSITETIITIWHTNNMYLLISLKLAILTRLV